MDNIRLATFAGGCFWCLQGIFDSIKGVIKTQVGYSGGDKLNPTYEEVSSGITGYYEAIQVQYNPELVDYETLVNYFWYQIDPTDDEGQFADKGSQYKTAIFYHNDEQRNIAEKSKQNLEKSGKFDKPIKTQIIAYKNFYPAEEYHQHYYQKNALHYNMYKQGSGRGDYIKNTWSDNKSKLDMEQKKKELTPLQYEVTQMSGTEKSFDNEYWDNKKPGIYVDIISGEPLFSSDDKFDSGTGWPSFTQPIEEGHIIILVDDSNGMVRTEVKSKQSNSHLGHVFDDGPLPTKKRYCMNSSALKFIPLEDMEKEGYGDYTKKVNAGKKN